MEHCDLSGGGEEGSGREGKSVLDFTVEGEGGEAERGDYGI